MKAKFIFLLLALVTLFSCSSKQQNKTDDAMRILADSMDAANNQGTSPVNTDAFVGRWVTTYSAYAYTMTVQLTIAKVGTLTSPAYSCDWIEKDQFGANHNTFHWYALSKDETLTGSDNAKGAYFTIHKNNEGNLPSIHATLKIKYSGDLPWEGDFTH